MATPNSVRPLAGLKSALRQVRAEKQQSSLSRWYATASPAVTGRGPINFHPGAIMRGRNDEHSMKKIRVYPQPPAPGARNCKDPIAAITQSQLSVLDPSGARLRLFSKLNEDRAKVGDILLVRLKSGDPFAGVCINIRHTGIDTAILLRNQLTRVGVEMWYKIYSPNVEGIEVVQRKEKRARRARLYYMRLPRHDIGSVENIVRQYQRQRAMLRSSEFKTRDSNASKKKNNNKGSK